MLKIPKKQIIGIIFIFLAILSGLVFLWDSGYSREINDLEITNITDTAFTVVWTTNTPSKSEVLLLKKENNDEELKNNIFYDDRLEIKETNIIQEFFEIFNHRVTSHHVTVSDLVPEDEYQVVINNKVLRKSTCHEDNCRDVATLPIPDTIVSPNVIYGKFIDSEGIAINDAIVTVEIESEDGDVGMKRSTTITEEGTYALDISGIHSTKSMKIIPTEKIETENIGIISASKILTSLIPILPDEDQPVVDIIVRDRLGQLEANQEIMSVVKAAENTESCSAKGMYKCYCQDECVSATDIGGGCNAFCSDGLLTPSQPPNYCNPWQSPYNETDSKNPGEECCVGGALECKNSGNCIGDGSNTKGYCEGVDPTPTSTPVPDDDSSDPGTTSTNLGECVGDENPAGGPTVVNSDGVFECGRGIIGDYECTEVGGGTLTCCKGGEGFQLAWYEDMGGTICEPIPCNTTICSSDKQLANPSTSCIDENSITRSCCKVGETIKYPSNSNLSPYCVVDNRPVTGSCSESEVRHSEVNPQLCTTGELTNVSFSCVNEGEKVSCCPTGQSIITPANLSNSSPYCGEPVGTSICTEEDLSENRCGTNVVDADYNCIFYNPNTTPTNANMGCCNSAEGMSYDESIDKFYCSQSTAPELPAEPTTESEVSSCSQGSIDYILNNRGRCIEDKPLINNFIQCIPPTQWSIMRCCGEDSIVTQSEDGNTYICIPFEQQEAEIVAAEIDEIEVFLDEVVLNLEGLKFEISDPNLNEGYDLSVSDVEEIIQFIENIDVNQISPLDLIAKLTLEFGYLSTEQKKEIVDRVLEVAMMQNMEMGELAAGVGIDDLSKYGCESVAGAILCNGEIREKCTFLSNFGIGEGDYESTCKGDLDCLFDDSDFVCVDSNNCDSNFDDGCNISIGGECEVLATISNCEGSLICEELILDAVEKKVCIDRTNINENCEQIFSEGCNIDAGGSCEVINSTDGTSVLDNCFNGVCSQGECRVGVYGDDDPCSYFQSGCNIPNGEVCQVVRNISGNVYGDNCEEGSCFGGRCDGVVSSDIDPCTWWDEGCNVVEEGDCEIKGSYSNCEGDLVCSGRFKICEPPAGGQDHQLFSSVINKVGAQPKDINTGTGLYSVSSTDYELTTEKLRVVDTDEDGNPQINYFLDMNSNGFFDDGDILTFDIPSESIRLTKESSGEIYSMNIGWNLVGFPMLLESGDIKTADDVLRSMNDDGVYATQITKYEKGRWVAYSYRASVDKSYGTNFELIPGEGYFIKSLNRGRYMVVGNKYAESVELPLQGGWNLVSVVSPEKEYTAESLMTTMQAEAVNVDVVSRYKDGYYTNLIVSEEITYGNDFKINDMSGYFIRLQNENNSELSWKP